MCTGILADESRSSDLREPLEPAIAPVAAVVQKSGRIKQPTAFDYWYYLNLWALWVLPYSPVGFTSAYPVFPSNSTSRERVKKGRLKKRKEKKRKKKGLRDHFFYLGLVKSQLLLATVGKRALSPSEGGGLRLFIFTNYLVGAIVVEKSAFLQRERPRRRLRC